MTDHKLTLREKLHAYKLTTNVDILLLLLAGTAVSIGLYLSPIGNSVSFFNELSLAAATSFLASIFCLFSDVYVQFKNCERDGLLSGLHEFGIQDLHFNKGELISRLLPACEKTVWISGYRMLLTSRLAPQFRAAVARGASARLLLCPPWSAGFQMVYGRNEKVSDCYLRVIHALYEGCGGDPARLEVRFTHKPLFNDTYRLDDQLITGPYMHNRDQDHRRISANDFFTYDLIRKSRLYELVEEEFLTLWDEAAEQLDLAGVPALWEDVRTNDYRDAEKLDKLHALCVPLHPDAAGEPEAPAAI